MKDMKKKIICTLYSVLCTLSVHANSPYLHKVWEFVPAPGQFTNELPKYEEGNTADDMCRKVEELIAHNTRGMISLGAWGGYLVFSFDHPVQNVPGENDFIVEGNAFYTSAAAGAAGGGSSEPGVVMVSYDENGNGLPDDVWYELAGSAYTHSETKHHYRVAYARTTEHEDVPWTDNEQQTGVVEANNFHKQNFFPMWIDSDSLVFDGVRLPDNYKVQDNQYILYPYDYGYADNHPDTCRLAQLNIEWAVDAEGTPVHLNEVHFIKVYTALLQQCGMLGETSTEITGARDLHPDAAEGLAPIRTQSGSRKILRNGQLMIIRNNIEYNPLGTILTTIY